MLVESISAQLRKTGLPWVLFSLLVTFLLLPLSRDMGTQDKSNLKLKSGSLWSPCVQCLCLSVAASMFRQFWKIHLVWGQVGGSLCTSQRLSQCGAGAWGQRVCTVRGKVGGGT